MKSRAPRHFVHFENVIETNQIFNTMLSLLKIDEQVSGEKNTYGRNLRAILFDNP